MASEAAAQGAFTHPGVRRLLHGDGTVARVYASRAATYAWANRDGALWPCSGMAGRAVRADFARNGDLLDLEVNGRPVPAHLDGHELSCLLDDLRGPRGHRWAVGAKPKPGQAARYAYRITDHYGNRQVVDRATRDARAKAGRVADWKRVRVPLDWTETAEPRAAKGA